VPGNDPSIASQLADARTWVAAAGPAAAQDPFHLYYTSGTSGTPKAVLLSHEIVIRHALGCIEGAQSAAWASIPVFCGGTHSWGRLSTLPIAKTFFKTPAYVLVPAA
jgi:long-subunit acyl-CoA synthetase (AMP-forming)